jgi:hypothetical protein
MCPVGYPKNTCLTYTPSTNETNPFHSCHGFQVPVQTWTPSPRTWGPTSIWCLDLHLSPPPISQSGKSWSPWQESNKSFRSHKQVCAQDNKSVTWPGSMQRTVLNWHGQGNSATQLCPVAAGHNLLHPPIPIPARSPFPFHHFIEVITIILIIIYCE